MRKTTLAAFLGAVLIAPAAWAMPRRAPDAQPQRQQMQLPQTNHGPAGSSGSLGGGMMGNEQGHVTGPGRTPVDNSSRGPLNDANPGAPPSEDVPSSTNPKPVR
jgi:hypothetical protein